MQCGKPVKTPIWCWTISAGGWAGLGARPREDASSRETLIRDLLDGQYHNPARIVAFNTTEGWSRDVTKDIADELRRRFVEYDTVPASLQDFVETASRAR